MMSDPVKFLLGKADEVEAAAGGSRCRLRLAGALRAAAADLRDKTDNQLLGYVETAYSRSKSN